MGDGLCELPAHAIQRFCTNTPSQSIEVQTRCYGYFVNVLGVVRQIFAVLLQVQRGKCAHVLGAETVNKRFQASADLRGFLDTNSFFGGSFIFVLQILFDETTHGLRSGWGQASRLVGSWDLKQLRFVGWPFPNRIRLWCNTGSTSRYVRNQFIDVANVLRPEVSQLNVNALASNLYTNRHEQCDWLFHQGLTA